jgi:hypothetical protein
MGSMRGVAPAKSTYERKHSLRFLIDRIQDKAHSARECFPSGPFGCKLFPTEWREAIIPGALAFVREFLGGCDPTLQLEAMESWVQRTGFHLEQVLRRALNVFGDAMTVRGTQNQCSEDENMECALQEFQA